MNCAFVYVTIQLNYNMLRTIPRDNGLNIFCALLIVVFSVQDFEKRGHNKNKEYIAH